MLYNSIFLTRCQYQNVEKYKIFTNSLTILDSIHIISICNEGVGIPEQTLVGEKTLIRQVYAK